MTLPAIEDFLRGCDAYERNEQRDSMYKVSSTLINNSWGKTADMTDALGVLLLTWNNAFYRYGQFDFGELETCIQENWSEIEYFHQREIFLYSVSDDKVISQLFGAFLQSLRIASGKNKGRRSPVSVAKALHLLAPRFFPIWDDKIAKAYKCSYARNPELKYIMFCQIARQMAVGLAPHVKRRNRSILKLIDEYNYARYTKKWI